MTTATGNLDATIDRLDIIGAGVTDIEVELAERIVQHVPIQCLGYRHSCECYSRSRRRCWSFPRREVGGRRERRLCFEASDPLTQRRQGALERL